MKSVYEASTGLDAHMILGLLEQQRIPGRIEGEYLQGGVGGLQAMGLVRVLVSDADYAEARKIISEWESVQPAEYIAVAQLQADALVAVDPDLMSKAIGYVPLATVSDLTAT